MRKQGRGEIAARFLVAVGLLALDITYHRWIAEPHERSYRDLAAETLDELVAQASELLGPEPGTVETALRTSRRVPPTNG